MALAIPSEDVIALIFTQSRGNGLIRRFIPGVWEVLNAEPEG